MTLSEIKPYTKLPFNGVIMPSLVITDEQRKSAGAKAGCNNLEFITQLCRNGFKEKIASKVGKDKHKVYADRVKEELGIISELGFIDYILSVWDICWYADQNGIPRGPGRGSVGGSLVAYLVGITEIDPVEHALFFTRFLSKARAKSKIVDGIRYIEGSLVPDVDLDFSFYRRGEIIQYLNDRYPGQTSKLLTTTTFSSKILIKDVLKIYENGTEEQANEASGLIEKEAGIPEDIEIAVYGDKKWQEGNKENGKAPNEKFAKWAELHEETARLAMSLADLNRGEGQHASAVLVAHEKIKDIMPLQLSSEKEFVSAFDMQSAQELAIKMDILGLRTLDVIQAACKQIGISSHDIDIHHPSIYQYLQNFKLRYGIFQLETFAQGNGAAKVKPKNFEQLGAVLAICRPGAFAYLDQYCSYVHEGKFTSVHPLIDDVLKPTGGVCLYQEQYLAMLVKIGMTPEQAENARRVLGKKKVEEVPIIKAQIVEICEKNGHPKEIVDLLLKIAEDSGGYSFNKSHSFSYAIIAARTLYIKANYPIQFYLALLRMARHESAPHEVLQAVESEMRVHGFKLLPPHFIKSRLDFEMEGEKSIRFALGLVRGISDKNAEKLEMFRSKASDVADNKFAVLQSAKNSGLNIGLISSLIQAGCLDGYDSYVGQNGKTYHSRSRLVLEAQTFNLLTDAEKGHLMTAGPLDGIKWDVLLGVKYLKDVAKNEKGKPVINERRFVSIKKKYDNFKEIYLQNSKNERLANFWYERHALGYSYSETISDIFAEHVDGLMSIAKIKELPNETNCRTIGFVKEEPYKSKTQKGNSQLKIVLTDETGEITIRAFNDKIDLIESQNGRQIQEGDLLICNLRKMSEDMAFAQIGPDGQSIGIQTAKIYLKLSQLKDAKAKDAEAETKVTEKVAAPSK